MSVARVSMTSSLPAVAQFAYENYSHNAASIKQTDKYKFCNSSISKVKGTTSSYTRYVGVSITDGKPRGTVSSRGIFFIFLFINR